MPRYSFSHAAHVDLDTITGYTLKNWGADQTMAYLDGLEETVKKLANHPKLGKPYHDLATGLRSFQYQSHVIYYLEQQADIVIVRVLHERMSAPLHINPNEDNQNTT